MGAFETFVNANLGIRKPLILDVGHPTDSSKAAGVVGSEYVDTQTNNVYEKPEYASLVRLLKNRLQELKQQYGDQDETYPDLMRLRKELW